MILKMKKPSDGEAPVLEFGEYGVLFHYHWDLEW